MRLSHVIAMSVSFGDIDLTAEAESLADIVADSGTTAEPEYPASAAGSTHRECLGNAAGHLRQSNPEASAKGEGKFC